MPYFVYRISPDHGLTLLETFERYRDARAMARVARATQTAEDGEVIRMIFAENPQKARLLLTDTRNPKVEGDD